MNHLANSVHSIVGILVVIPLWCPQRLLTIVDSLVDDCEVRLSCLAYSVFNWLLRRKAGMQEGRKAGRQVVLVVVFQLSTTTPFKIA